jgi:hypothetical protein
MSTLNRQEATAVLEDRVTKISKAMAQLVKDAPRIADILDDATLLKTERFIQRRLGDLMRDMALARAARPSATSFSLDAEPEVPATAVRFVQVPASDTAVVLRGPTTPSVPQNDDAALNDDDLSVLEVLDVATGGGVSLAPAQPEPKRWRKPIGRLAGSKELIYGDPEEFKVSQPEPGEQPDRTGGIADAGFIDD